MSFLSGLLKIGGLVAAPFSGGASLALTGAGGLMDKIGGAAGAAGSMMGAQQGGANNARVAQGQLNQGADRNLLDRYQLEQAAQNQAAQTDLQRKSFESSNRSTTAKQALIAALLGGQGGAPMPTNISGGQRSGGLFDALRTNPDAIAALRNLHGQADQAQMAPMQFSGGNILAAPKLSQVPQIDTGNGVMGTMAKIAQIMGAVSPYLHKGEGE